MSLNVFDLFDHHQSEIICIRSGKQKSKPSNNHSSKQDTHEIGK